MLIAKLPSDDELRQHEVESLGILDTPSEKEMDDLIELAAQICNCPVSFISLLDKDRQWFMAKKGIKISETPRDYSFCSHTVLQDDVMEINDALQDERFIDNPLVTGDPHIRFYAGAPIVSPSGHKLGAVCVIDHQPRQLTKEQRHSLTLMSKQVTHLLELRSRNRVIREKAEEMLALKNETIEKTLKDQELEKHKIATELHENLAQALAASRMYLDMAVKNEENRLALVKNSNAQLQDLLETMRSLSYSIMPSALDNIPLDQLFTDFIDKKKETVAFKLSLNCKGKSPMLTTHHTIACFRIVEQWLKVIENKTNITVARINLSFSKGIELRLEDNGNKDATDEIEKQIITNLVYHRVSSLGGDIKISTKNKKNILLVTIPFHKVDLE